MFPYSWQIKKYKLGNEYDYENNNKEIHNISSYVVMGHMIPEPLD